MKAHDRGEFAAQLVTDPFIEILGPEKSLHMGLKSPDFRSPKSRGTLCLFRLFLVKDMQMPLENQSVFNVQSAQLIE